MVTLCTIKEWTTLDIFTKLSDKIKKTFSKPNVVHGPIIYVNKIQTPYPDNFQIFRLFHLELNRVTGSVNKIQTHGQVTIQNFDFLRDAVYSYFESFKCSRAIYRTYHLLSGEVPIDQSLVADAQGNHIRIRDKA